MHQQSDNTKRLARPASAEDVNEAVEAVLRKHTAVICWNRPNQSPVLERQDNGTCSFIDTGTRRCVVTAAHVWEGFRTDSETGAKNLWISLTAGCGVAAPSFPYRVVNPQLISARDDLDLATFTFEGIDVLEGWRFYPLQQIPIQRVAKGDIIFFLGFTGDGLREGATTRRLNYHFNATPVADVGYRQFQLHDTPGTAQLSDATGRNIPPVRIPGVSGAPAFRAGDPLHDPLKLTLAGFVSRLLSPGFTECLLESVSAIPDPHHRGYELSDGDVYITYADLLNSDGTIKD